MATLSPESDRKIAQYLARPTQEFFLLDDKNMGIDVLNTYRVWIMRWLRDDRSPDLYVRDYTSHLMRSHLSTYQRKIVAHIWELTESPILEDIKEATVTNISLVSGLPQRETSAILTKLKDKEVAVSEQDREDKRKRLYRITDRFLASGLLLNYFPMVWAEKLETGEILKELDEAFEVKSVTILQPRLFYS